MNSPHNVVPAVGSGNLQLLQALQISISTKLKPIRHITTLWRTQEPRSLPLLTVPTVDRAVVRHGLDLRQKGRCCQGTAQERTDRVEWVPPKPEQCVHWRGFAMDQLNFP
jgi:hypothetical protein